MPANSIQIEAKLKLTGPYNVDPVVSALNRKLGNVSANVKVKIDTRSITAVDNLTKHLRVLNTELKRTTALTNDLDYAITKLTGAFQGLGKINNTVANVAKTEQAISKVQRTTVKATSELERFGQSAAFAIRRFSAFTVAVGAVFGFVRAIQLATTEAIDFEKQIIKTVQVQGSSKAAVAGLVADITRLSTSLGVSSKELIDVAQTLAQAGLSAKDTRKALEALAKSSLAPTFNDIKNTTEAAIAAMNQFRLEAGDLESVLGSINSVAAAFAAEAEDLTTVIRKTGAVFASAGSQLDDPKKQLNELLALFTSVRSTTRESAETIATGFRTIFARLQRSSTIEFLRNFNIELTDTQGKFVGVFEAVRRLNAGLAGFQSGDLQFAEIVKELAGRGEQLSKVIPLIQQFPKALNALNVANQGSNSLTRDQIIAQESLANALARTREEFLALVRGITETDTFRVMTRSILGLASSLIKVAETLKPVLPLITALAGAKLATGGLQFLTGFGRELHLGGGLGGAGAGIGRSLTRRSKGGSVPGRGDHDSVLSLLTPGEFVINKKAVSRLGPRVLNNINKFANGGLVGGSSSGSGSGRLAVGGEFDIFEFSVKGAAQAIDQFRKSVSDAAINIAKSAAAASPTASAIAGKPHVERLADFPLSAVSGNRALGKVSTKTQVPLIGTPIVGKFGSGGKARTKFDTKDQQFIHAFGDRERGVATASTRLSLDKDLPRLAEDLIPFDSDPELRGPGNNPFTGKAFNLNRLNRGKLAPLVTRRSPGLGGQPPKPTIGTTFAPPGENIEKLVRPFRPVGLEAVMKKLPRVVVDYEEALQLATKELQTHGSVKKAGLALRREFSKRSINSLRTEEGVAGISDLRDSAALKEIGGLNAFNAHAATKAKRGSLAFRAGNAVGKFGRGAASRLGSPQGLSALATGGFLAAGALESSGHATAASSVSGALTGGALGFSVGGPAGAGVGAAIGAVVGGLDRFASETNRIAQSIENEKFDSIMSELATSLKNGGGNVDKIIREGRSSIDKQQELDNAPNRSLDTVIGSNILGPLADLITRGQTIGGNSATEIGRTKGASGLVFEEIANLFGTQNRGLSKEEQDAQKKKTEQLKQLADPQFEAIKQKIAGGTALKDVRISSEQKSLFKDAGKDLQELFNADKVRAAQEAVEHLTQSLDLVVLQFDKLTAVTEAQISVIEQQAREQRDIGDIFSGSTRVGAASSRAGNILSNVNGFDANSVGGALRSVGADARTSSVITSGKKALAALPGVFANVRTDNPDQARTEIVKSVRNLHLDKSIEDSILQQIDSIDISAEGENNFRDKLKEVAEGLEANVGKLVDPAVKSAQALAKKQEAAGNAYIESLNRITDAQAKLRETVFNAADTRVSGNRAIAEAQGRNFTTREATAGFNAKAAALGVTGPAGLGSRISGLRNRAASLTAARNNAVPGSQEFNKLSDQLQAINNELEKAQTALDLFSKDTTLASDAADRLSKAESKRSVGREVAGGILGNNKLGFAKQISSLQKFQSGDLTPLFTSFEDLQAAVELQAKFLRANGKEAEARKVEENFDAGIGKALGPEFAALFKSVRDEEAKARADQVKAAQLQIQAAQETIVAQQAALKFYTGAVPRRAGGGAIYGPGTATSDSINARLSNGEYVVRAAAVRDVGVDTLNHINEHGELPGFATGGAFKPRQLYRDRFERSARRSLARRQRLSSRGNNRALSGARYDALNTVVAGRTTFGGDPREFKVRGSRFNFGGGSPLRYARHNAQIAHESRRNSLRDVTKARRAKIRSGAARRAGFASGGLVEGGGGVNLGEGSIASLNNFVIAANSLANALQNVNIPTQIQLVGTHDLNVNLNGATALANMMEPLRNFVLNEINNAMRKYDNDLRG